MNKGLVKIQAHSLELGVLFGQFDLPDRIRYLHASSNFYSFYGLKEMLSCQSHQVARLFCLEGFGDSAHIVSCIVSRQRRYILYLWVFGWSFLQSGQLQFLFSRLVDGFGQLRFRFLPGDQFVKGEAGVGLDALVQDKRRCFGSRGSDFRLQRGAYVEIEGFIIKGVLILGQTRYFDLIAIPAH